MSPDAELDRPRGASISDEEWKNRIKLPKKLIVCCDGTWMDSDNGWVPGKWGQPGHLQNPTNVTRIARAIKDEDDGHHPQIVYYQAGIGTGIGLYNHLVGGGTGLGIDNNLREAYAFLANNYAEHRAGIEPDSIFLLGFSRGAYTARSLGGLICALGVLKKRAMPHFHQMFYDWEMAGDKHHTPAFFTAYFKHHHDNHHHESHDHNDHSDVQPVQPPLDLARNPSRRDEYLALYKQYLLDLNLTQDVQIKSIGVWDTVGALGIPVNPIFQQLFPMLPSFIRQSKWFDTRLDNKIHNAFHALALDERRFPYSPAIWEKPDHCTTNLKHVWFPGAHSNVGGSYADAGTADITLAWMMDQLAGHTTHHTPIEEGGKGFVHHDWIKFDDAYLRHWSECQTDFYTRHDLSAYRAWGRGKLYDSNTFPQSLAGQRTRAPGRYHRTFYESGRTDRRHLLRDTNEYVHACVRTRIDLGGRGVEPDDSDPGASVGLWLQQLWHRFTGAREKAQRSVYAPQGPGGPLHGWRLEDGHERHYPAHTGDVSMKKPLVGGSGGREEGVRWVFEGSERLEKGVMLEDKLGPYERILLGMGMEEGVASQVVYSNNGWKGVEESHEEMVLRHARTL